MSDTSSFSKHLLERKSNPQMGLLEFGHFGYMWSREGSNRLIASHTVYELLGVEAFSILLTVETYRANVHPDDLELLMAAEERLLLTGAPCSVDYRIICKNGNEKYIRHHMQVSPGPSGIDRKITSILDDISGQKRADVILEIMNEVFFELDDRDVLRKMNKKAALYWGTKASDCIGRNIWQIFPEAINSALYYLIKTAQQAKNGATAEILSPQGRWSRASVTPSHGGSIVLIYDKHEEKEAELSLHKSKAQWERLMRNTPDIITRWDASLKLIYANPVFEEKMGKNSMEMIGKNSIEMGVNPENANPWMDKLRQVFETKSAADHFDAHSSQNGRAFFYTRLVPECNEDEIVESVLAIGRDITELKENERDIEAMNDSLIKKNADLEERHKEMASLSDVASDELKEPLRKIYTAVEWILSHESRKLSDGGRANFRRLQSAVQKMGLITDDLLTFINVSKAGSDLEDDVDLNDILKKSEEKLNRNIAEKGAKINAEQLPHIKGNPSLLLILFQQILQNALKFQPKDNLPVIDISCAINKKQDKAFSQTLIITFRDNGIGFDNNSSSDIFGLFTKLHNAEEFRGSGMGLALCKKIMEYHNGQIKASGEPGKGASFDCIFPLLAMRNFIL